MIDVSGIEYDFLPSVLWTVGLMGLCIAAFILGVKNFEKWWSAFPGALGIVGTAVVPLMLLLIAPSSYMGHAEIERVTEQLSDQGFSRVDLNWEGKTFTASVDGEYFEGLLHPVGDYKYQVLEVGEVTP